MAEGTWVGLDVHARKTVAGGLDASTGELRSRRAPTLPAETVEWLQGFPAPVRVAYEAGPTGYGLARACVQAGMACTVAAPSKIPRASGDRVKTDRRDAERLARLLRLGELVAVRVPEPHEEAARDLVRAREDARGELMRARHRLSKLLLRQGIVYSGGQAWTEAHDRWLRRQHFDQAATRATFESDYEATLTMTGRRDRLDKAIAEMAGDSEFTPIVRRLCCLRGVSTLTGFALAVEIGDWHRFTGNSIGSFVGLVPSEYSSGASRVQGSITKTGNTHVRRLLVEAAWHHRARYVAGKTLRDRWELAPTAERHRGDAGNRRLHERWVKFNLRRKPPVIANVAIARELAGWCWSLAVLD